MALNANEVAGGGRKIETLPVGSYPARVLAVYDIGKHARSFAGEDKEPKQEVMLVYEFLDEYLKDDNGDDQLDKPRVLSESFPFNNPKQDKAKSTLRAQAMDPGNKFKYNFSEFVNLPCNVSIVHNPGKDGRVWEKIAGVSAMREKDAAKARELINKPKVFDMDDPDVEVFNQMPQWVQEKIKSALDFKGSKLEGLLGTTVNQAVPPKDLSKKAVAKEEESPF